MIFKILLIWTLVSFQAMGSECTDIPTHVKALNDSSTYRYNPKELSEISYVKSPKAVVLLLHGLNLKPSKMNELAAFLKEQQFTVIRGALAGHRGSLKEQKSVKVENWLNDVGHLKCLVQITMEKQKIPAYFLGYSLGALAVMAETSKTDHQIFSRQLLIAPATHAYWFTEIPGYLRFLPGHWSIPSKNLVDYRAEKSTSLNAYRAMNELRDLFYTNIPIHKISTIVYMDPDDELVNLDEILKFKQKNNFGNWEIVKTTNAKSLLKSSFHHLIIDRQSLGNAHWKGLLAILKKHFK